jgi:choline kinase
VHGLILAAGCGSRLGTRSPKCLARVGGTPLLHIQLDALCRAGVNDVTIVVGYRHDEVRSSAFGRATFVHNRRFFETNSLYSFHLARSMIEGDLVVLNSDVLFPLEMLERLLHAPGSSLAYDSGSGGHEEHMKVQLRNGQLVGMSKQLPPAHVHGENVGLLHLAESAAQASFDAAARLIADGHHHDWLGSAISAVAGTHAISGVDISGLPWVEIDYPEDLALARSEIWPTIQSLDLFAERRREPVSSRSVPQTRTAAAG